MIKTLPFKSLPEEVSCKLNSLITLPDAFEAEFLKGVRSNLGDDMYAHVNKTIAFIKSLKSTNEDHPDLQRYFGHPLRVANFLLNMLTEPSQQILDIALLHNIYEITDISEFDLIRLGYSQEIARAVRVLTTDRNCDTDETYLSEYYNNIVQYGNDLVLVKCIDRIDNLLGMEIVERNSYSELYISFSKQFVLPQAYRLFRSLGEYLEGIFQYLNNAPYNEEYAQKYKLFIAQEKNHDQE